MILYNPDSKYPITPSAIPSEWVLTNLGNIIISARQGVGTGRHNKMGIGVPHMRPMNISRFGKIVLNDVKYVEKSNFRTLAPGDVLFNNTNSADLVGKTAVFDQVGEYYFSNHMTRIRLPYGVSPHFVGYQLLHLFIEGYFRARRTQHVNQASIKTSTLTETVPMVLAPSEEQIQIVAELDRIFSCLEIAESLINNAQTKLNEYEKQVFHAAANGSLTICEEDVANESSLLDDFTHVPQILNQESFSQAIASTFDENVKCAAIVFNNAHSSSMREHPNSILPSGWVWSQVSKVGTINLGRQRAPQHHEGKHLRPYLRVANVFDGYINTSDVHEMNFTPDEFKIYKVEPGDILLNEGQSPELVGRAAMFKGELEGICFQNTLIRFRANKGVSPGFALLVFRSYLHSGRFRSIARWTTNIAHLGLTRFSELEFPLPPLQEQERIVHEADRRLEKVGALKEILASITKRIHDARRLALREAFMGKLVATERSEGEATELLNRIRQQKAANLVLKLENAGRNAMQSAKKKQTKDGRRTIIDVLKHAESALTPEELLQQSGIGEDLIDEFYSELKREYDLGKVIQDRDEAGCVHLRLAGDMT